MEGQAALKKRKNGTGSPVSRVDPVAYFFRDANLVQGCLLSHLTLASLQRLSVTNRRLKQLLYDHYDLVFRRMWKLWSGVDTFRHSAFREAFYRYYNQRGRDPSRFIRSMLSEAESEAILVGHVYSDRNATAARWFLNLLPPARRMGCSYAGHFHAAADNPVGTFFDSCDEIRKACQVVAVVVEFGTRDGFEWHGTEFARKRTLFGAVYRRLAHQVEYHLQAHDDNGSQGNECVDALTKFIEWWRKV